MESNDVTYFTNLITATIAFTKTISWSSAVSIVFGASISAFVGYILQRNSFAEARRQKAVDRFELRKLQAYSLLFKMIRIHSNVVQIDKAFRDSIAAAELHGLAGATLWQKIIPLANSPPRTKFTSDEMALILSLDFQLFNEIGPYDEIYSSLIDTIELYGKKREALMEKYGATMSGSLGTTGLTQDQMEWFAPRSHVLNSLAEQILSQLSRDVVEAKELLLRMNALFSKEFSFNPKLEFVEPA